MDEAEDGNVAAVKLALQTTGVVGSGGGANVHVGTHIDKQLNQFPGQQPGQRAYGDHRDTVFRAANEAEFQITVESGNMMAAEMLAREERGEPALTDEQQLRSIKIATELVISERAAKEAVAGEITDVTPIEQGEAD